MLLLMFFAGLEIDLSQFRRTGGRSLVFGFLTFSIPQVVGTGVGMMAGYGWLAAVLIGSLMASHTLLGFPILQGMKLGAEEAVAVTIGGTVSPISRHFWCWLSACRFSLPGFPPLRLQFS